MPRTTAPAQAPAARHALAIAGLAVLVGVAYANALDGGFVLDSWALVLENPVLRQATASNVTFLLTHDYWQPMATGGLYRPLATLSFLLNWAVLGNADRPQGYHALNLLLHLTCASLVYTLLWRLVRRSWVALFGAALFAVHPITTEAVTSIVGRADLLYSNLSLAYARLQRFADALEAYRALRRLDPSNPEHYADISAVLLTLGRWEDGASALFAALALRPGDAGLGARLVEVYRVFDPDGGALVHDGPDRGRLDLTAPVVRRHRCQGYRELAEVYAEANDSPGAARARALAAPLCEPLPLPARAR